MSLPLVRFIHISDTHIEPEAGVAERLASALVREQARTELPENIRTYILATLDEQSQAASLYPYPSAIQACEAMVGAINALDAPIDLVLHTGDIAQQGTAEDYTRVRSIFGGLRVPIYYVNGNHDKVENVYPGLLGQGTSNEPYDHIFEVNGVLFVCVDSATNKDGTEYFLTDGQLAWLETHITAADDRPVVVGIHHPPYQIFHEAKDYFIIRNADAIHEVLRKAGPKLRGVFSGHVHVAMNHSREGVFYSIAPKAFSATPGFSIVTVTEDGILVDHKRF